MKKTFYLFSVILSLALCSCGDDEKYDFPGDSGKVYVRLQSSHMVNSVANVVDATIGKTILGTNGEAVVAFPIRTTMPANGALNAICEIDNSLVDTYNTTHGTDYAPMDADIILFENQSATIESGQMESADQIVVRVDPAKMVELELGDYLVPIKLSSVSGDMSVSANWNVVYLHVSVVNDVTGVPCADRTGWTIADVSSFQGSDVEGGNNGPAEAVLDGNYFSYWQTQWSPFDVYPPHYITIDMAELRNLAGIQYISRNHNLDWPKSMYVETSTDGISFERVAEYENLPQGGNVEFRALFDEIVEARYFRLTITEMYGGRPYTSLAEVNAFIMNN